MSAPGSRSAKRAAASKSARTASRSRSAAAPTGPPRALASLQRRSSPHACQTRQSTSSALSPARAASPATASRAPTRRSGAVSWAGRATSGSGRPAAAARRASTSNGSLPTRSASAGPRPAGRAPSAVVPAAIPGSADAVPSSAVGGAAAPRGVRADVDADGATALRLGGARRRGGHCACRCGRDVRSGGGVPSGGDGRVGGDGGRPGLRVGGRPRGLQAEQAAAQAAHPEGIGGAEGRREQRRRGVGVQLAGPCGVAQHHQQRHDRRLAGQRQLVGRRGDRDARGQAAPAAAPGAPGAPSARAPPSATTARRR